MTGVQTCALPICFPVTLGPLFGSFKLQHFMFFAGFRLYNSWLHNNRTGIGMKMSEIKLPKMIANTKGSPTDARTDISSSALYKYLGWTKSRRTGTNATAGVYKNGVPLLLYLDTFKNFFANTQEDKFYIDRKSTRLNSSHRSLSRMPSSA